MTDNLSSPAKSDVLKNVQIFPSIFLTRTLDVPLYGVNCMQIFLKTLKKGIPCMKNLHSIAAALCGTLLLCGSAAKGAPQEKKTLSMKEDYISQVRDWSESKEFHMMPTMQWEAKKEYKIVYRAPEKQMLSFRVWEWAYVGGAHGMPNTVVGTFKNGKRLKLKDIAPTREKRLCLEKAWQQAIARHFKAQSFEALLKSRRHFKPRMTENFFLNEKGITFVYDPYEIASFGEGTIDIFVPWK